MSSPQNENAIYLLSLLTYHKPQFLCMCKMSHLKKHSAYAESLSCEFEQHDDSEVSGI